MTLWVAKKKEPLRLVIPKYLNLKGKFQKKGFVHHFQVQILFQVDLENVGIFRQF